MKRTIIIILLAFVFGAAALISEPNSENDRRRTGEQARRATPDELQERLRQAGISREEAIQRARREGVSLEEILFPENDLRVGDIDRLRQEQRFPVTSRTRLDSVKAERLELIGTTRELAQRRAQAEGETLIEFLFPEKPEEEVEEEMNYRIQLYGLTREEAQLTAHMHGLTLEEFVFPGLPDPVLFWEDELVDVTIPEPEFRPEEFADRENAMNLDAFGYNIFDFPATTFEPVLSISPPANYRLGPGDELVISVWGQVQLYYSPTVNREGFIIIPDVGQVMVNGLTLEQIRERLLQRMSQVYSSLGGGASANSFLDVSVGKLRTIQVFVLGDVRRPGGYTLSSMSTAFKALYYSGGPTLKGSLRDIRVMRGNREAARLDFYTYALKGDQSGDVRLEDGDIIFVPPAGKRAALAGRVVRPAVYELKEGERLGELISMAGGLRFDARIDRIHIERIVPFSMQREFKHNILDIDVMFDNDNDLLESEQPIEAGDVVTISRRQQRLENRVRVIGNVNNPGIYELAPGMTVRDLIHRADGLLDDTYINRATIVRTQEESMRKEVIPVHLKLAMDNDENNNHKLKRLDELYVYARDYFYPQQTVSIWGEVKHPGTYTRAEGMRVEDLIVLAGGVTENAMLSEVNVVRIDTMSERRYSNIYKIPIPHNFTDVHNPGGFLLEDFDRVEIPYDPRRIRDRIVEIYGEIMHQGRYAIQHDEERISTIVERAGGLKETAYLEGARYFRDIEGTDRLVPISVKRAIENPNSRHNIIVRHGDEIRIPRDPGVVIVRGAVNVPAAVAYEPGKGPGYYINQAGGFAENADRKRKTVTLPNGRTWESSGWFFIPNDDLLSGSIINVPEKEPKEGRAMEILRDWTTLMASTAAIIVGIVQITR